MAYRLTVSRESCWRGCILDTVTPLVNLDLEPLGKESQSLHAETKIKLTNGEEVTVACGYSPWGTFGIGVNSGLKRFPQVQAEGPISMDLVLNDGLLYQFSLKKIED